MKNHYNCIYMYINKINGHKYVGQAKDFNRRHRNHIYESKNKNNKYYNLPFNIAIRKYGIENFNIVILKENLSSKCLLDFYECYYIEKYNCLSRENYNISSGGSNGNNFAGKTEEEMNEIKRKISESNTGKSINVGINNGNVKRLIARYNLNGILIDIKYDFEYKKMGFGNHISQVCKWYECNENLEEWYKTHKNRPRKTMSLNNERFIFKYYN